MPKHFSSALPRLSVSTDGRSLVQETDTFFFWLADTAWELIHRLNREEIDYYLDVRCHQGFNVIQTAALAELDGLRTPNAYGDLPLHDDHPLRPNEHYFQHVDYVVQATASRGMYVALLPAWGDKVNKRYDWAIGPEVFDETNAKQYGRWIAERYRAHNHVVWILGGDRDPDDRGLRTWRNMAEGITTAYEGDNKPAISFHPQPFHGGSSSRWFHDDHWLSFNMLQTGHDRDTAVYHLIEADHQKLPAKPVLNGEPTYEGHPINFKAAENGYSTDYDVRKAAYWSVFAGACGHTYGCHSTWQFFEAGRTGVNHPIYYWKESLWLAGAAQMQHLKRLINSRPMLQRMPSPHILVHHDLSLRGYTLAMADRNRSWVMVYTAQGSAFCIADGALPPKQWQYCWFNPKDGSATIATALQNEGKITFTPPGHGNDSDWVLILDDASAAYSIDFSGAATHIRHIDRL